jgi:hypothetical protein
MQNIVSEVQNLDWPNFAFEIQNIVFPIQKFGFNMKMENIAYKTKMLLGVLLAIMNRFIARYQNLHYRRMIF